MVDWSCSYAGVYRSLYAYMKYTEFKGYRISISISCLVQEQKLSNLLLLLFGVLETEKLLLIAWPLSGCQSFSISIVKKVAICFPWTFTFTFVIVINGLLFHQFLLSHSLQMNYKLTMIYPVQNVQNICGFETLYFQMDTFHPIEFMFGKNTGVVQWPLTAEWQPNVIHTAC